MTAYVNDPKTNLRTDSPAVVAQQIVLPAQEGTGEHAEPKIRIDFSPCQLRGNDLSLHPAQALAVARELVELAHRARDIEQWAEDLNRKVREFHDDVIRAAQ